MLKNYKKVLALCCKKSLISTIKECEDLDNNMKYKFAKEIYNMNNDVILKKMFITEQTGNINDLEPDQTRQLKYMGAAAVGGYAASKMGANVGVGIAGGAALGALALFVYRKVSNPCIQQAMKLQNATITQRRMHVHKCQANAARRVIAELTPRMSACAGAKNPTRCQIDLTNVINHWKQKYQDEMLKLSKLEKASAPYSADEEQ